MPITTIAAILLTAVLTIFIPLIGMAVCRKKDGTWKPFAVGAVTFVISALVLEQLLHTAVLHSPLADPLQSNIWLYALYGGLSAGIFEETGRLAAFRFLHNDRRPITALCYGIGHGGAEAVLITGLTMVNNLILLVITAQGGELDSTLSTAAQTILQTPAYLFLLAGFERVVAMGLHISLSVLVFAAVQKHRYGFYFLSIALHALCDFLTVIINTMVSPLALELSLGIYVVLVGSLAYRVYRLE